MIRRKIPVPYLIALPVLLALACSLPGSAGTPQATGEAPPATPVEETSPTAAVQTPDVPTATASPGSQPGSGPDVIYHNGHIITMDPAQPEAQALAVAGDRILAVGSDAEVLPLAGPDTLTIDLGGRTMLPGFIDTHTHRISQRFKWGYETVEEAALAALTQGWTTLDELAVGEGELAELQEAADQGRLPIRVNAFLLANGFAGEPLDDWYNAYSPGLAVGPNLRIAGLKVFIDFDSGRTLFFTQDELNTLLLSPELAGWQVAIKAIGIQSHELALNAIETALGGDSNDLHRYRLEHSLAVTDEQLARLASLQVIAAVQPSFPAVIWHEEDIRLLTEEQGQENIFRWSDYLAAGVFMVASPYNPDGVNEELIEPSHVSPMGLLYRSATQIGLAGAPPEPWMLEKAIGVADILPMLTIDAAYAAFEEDVKGSLTPGKYADLVVLSDNPLAVPAAGLLDIRVLLTVVGGQSLYCAAGEEALCPPESPFAQVGLLIVPAGEPVRIAALGPVTGNFSDLFALLLAAYGLAAEDFGPVGGHTVAFVPVDNPCSAEPGPFVLLLNQPPAGALGPFCSNGAMVALPALEALGIVAVSPGATRTDLPEFAPAVFNRVILNDDQLAASGLEAAYINDLPSVQAFYEEFESRTGLALPGDDLRPYVAYAYDAAMVLLQALAESAAVQNDGSLTIGRQALAITVRNTSGYEGLTGTITFDPSGNRIP